MKNEPQRPAAPWRTDTNKRPIKEQHKKLQASNQKLHRITTRKNTNRTVKGSRPRGRGRHTIKKQDTKETPNNLQKLPHTKQGPIRINSEQEHKPSENNLQQLWDRDTTHTQEQ